MSRMDISPYLIHFTRGENIEGAFVRLKTILHERCLRGSGERIRGGYRCVCFSEAPLSSLSSGLVNERYYSRYSPFGILVFKQWLFSIGGRPAIYETEEEYLSLPESHKWRHVRYDLRNGFERIDFSWEREWRIRCDILTLNPSIAWIIVPDNAWADHLMQEHDREQDYLVTQYVNIFDDQQIAEMHREPFQWQVVPLRP